MVPKVPFFRTPYNYDVDQASRESALVCKDESLTKQAFAEEADINTIVKRFGIGEQIPQDVRMPTFGDFTAIGTFHEAMNAIAQANEAFDAMPASVRARFRNDPGEFVAFCSDEKNRDEAVKLGLVVPPAPVVEPVAAPVAAPVAPAPAAPVVKAP